MPDIDYSKLFPCAQPPPDGPVARVLGVYAQIQQGLVLQRVRIPGGSLTATQWRALAAIARAFTPGTPLHLTTRQDVELHDLRPDDVPAVQRQLAQAGLTTLGAAGDAARNVTVCPCSGTHAGQPDLLHLATAVKAAMELDALAFGLPRKFKVSLSCSQTCGQPYIQDIGLVLAPRGGNWGVRVIAGGSLGPAPATGIDVLEWLPIADAPAMVRAALAVFAATGDRANRARARLRHVRTRVGDEAFRAMLTAELPLAREACGAYAPRFVEADVPDRADVAFDNGDVLPHHADALAELCGRPGVLVRITADHGVAVFGPSAQELVTAAGLPQAQGPRVVACPGTRWCKRGLVDAPAAAARLRAALAGRSDSLCVRISGCPNGCAHSAVAPVGLIGRRVSKDGVQHEAFDLWLGGELGTTPRLAARVATIDRLAVP